MSTIKTIRDRLGLTQTALANAIGCSQGNVGHYENKGQTMPPAVAKRLITFAASIGHEIHYEDIYGPVDEKEAATDQSVPNRQTEVA